VNCASGWLDIARKTFPNLINPLIKRTKSGMNALIVEPKYIANQYDPEKPVVVIQVLNNLFCRASDEANGA
jgi:hypothetical protein